MPFGLMGPIGVLGQLLLAACSVVAHAPLGGQILFGVVMGLAAVSFVGSLFEKPGTPFDDLLHEYEGSKR